MNYSKYLMLFVVLLNVFSLFSQEKTNGIKLLNDENAIAKNILPPISKDSTKAEITAHVEAMAKWMKNGLYNFKYTETLIYADKGIVLAKKTGDIKLLGDILATVGNTLIRVNDTTKAKKIFFDLLKEGKKARDSTIILQATGNIANLYYYLGKYDTKAIDNYNKAITIAEKLNDTVRLVKLHSNLAELYLNNNNISSSKFEIQNTDKYLKKFNYPKQFYAGHLLHEGQYNLMIKQPDKAIEKFKKAISIIKEAGFLNILYPAYNGFKEALEIKKDYKGIYEINKKLETFQRDKDSIDVQNIKDAVAAKLKVEQYKAQIKTNNLEKELLIQKAESKNILLILFFIAGLFLIAVTVIIYIANKKKKVLLKNLKLKNAQYLTAKNESEKLAKSKTKFFATVSHELRTPLYGVIGLSSILLENKELKKHEKDLKSLKFSANYLLALINDLLQMNKIDSNSFTKEETNFNIIDLVNTIIFSFEYIRLQHNNKIELIIDKNVPKHLRGNSVMLSQILMNLIGNACKFTENGNIDVIINLDNMQEDLANINFTIKDNGPGIETCKLKTIFDEFTQINSSTKTYQGTGLGLPIVKKLLIQAGSSINIESKLGEGTTFKFALALKVAPQFEENTSSSIKDTSKLANKHILVVEDNRINQIVTKKILKISNVNCDIAENGDEAVAKTKTQDYDLILMDINMPVKNGLDASKEIRTFNDKVPIVALTAVEIEEQKYQIFESGMNDIIVKPYDIDLFKQTILENLFTDKRKIFRKLG